jgi:hypothetical protein
MSLFIYSDYSTTVDPHTITTIFLIYWKNIMLLLPDGFVLSVFNSYP